MTNEQAIAFIKKNPIGVGCGLLALALGVASYYRGGEIPDLEDALAQKTAEGERHALNLKNATSLKDQYETLVAANKQIDARMIRPQQRAANSEFFYKLESATGVKLIDPQQNSTTPPKAKAQFSATSFSVSAQGDLPQLLNFLQQIEHGERYCRVMSAAVAANGGKRDGPLTLTISVELLGLP